MRDAFLVLRRWLIALHRWLGAGLSLLALMWFATGIVLIYAPLPSFSPDRQLARMPALDCSRCRGSLEHALARMPHRDRLAPVRLGMLLGRPVWRYRGLDARWHLAVADGGPPVTGVDGPMASALAAAYANSGSAPVAALFTLVAPDQWTLEGVLRRQLPLYRITLDDPAATSVYVSQQGGDVILATTRRDRALAWIGAIPHFLYPRVLRVRLGLWLNVVIVLAGFGALVSLSGLVVGVWLLRWRGRAASAPNWTRSPYRTGWMRWHHYLGLIFGLFTFTWMLSGMLSVDPLDWSPGDEPEGAETTAFAGGVLDGARFRIAPGEAARALGGALAVREVRPIMVAGHPYWLGIDAASNTRLLAADAPQLEIVAQVPPNVIDSATRAAAPSSIAELTTLRSPDDYYYQSDSRPRRFPVLRARFNDTDRTAYYIDPRLGAIAMKQVTRSRAERWLYTGLHDLDFRALRSRRPLWDVVVIALLLGGLSLAVTSLVGAWRWLAPKAGLKAGPRR